MRNLVSADPWRESLERSLARRGKPRSSSIELRQLRLGRLLAIENTPRREREDRTSARPRKPVKRSRARVRTAVSLATLALLAAGLGIAFSGGAPRAARAADVSRAGRSHSASAASISRASGRSGCPLAIRPTGYKNPLAAAVVRPERIDQGVDYAGAGALSAIGAARITYLATSGSGWPGAFIEYQLLAGADAGCYVYYAEGVHPIDGLTVGAIVSPGEAIATIIPGYPTGIELGWAAGAGTKPYAATAGQWSLAEDEQDIATPAGKSFSALIASLGGPPGKVEG